MPIQIGLMRIQKALIEDTISTKKAGLLLYSMQLALTNVGQTTFGQAKDEEMVRETVDEEEAFSEDQTPLTTKDTKDTKEIRPSSKQHQNQNQRPFTTEGTEETEEIGPSEGQRPFITEGTEDTEERETLPLMKADEGGLRERKPVHGAALAEGKIPPQRAPLAHGHADHREIGTPPRVMPHEHAEVHAILG